MNNLKLNIFINIASFLAFAVSALSGFLILFGYRSGMRQIHNVSSIIFIVLVLIHLILHWRWIKTCVLRI